MGQKSNTGASPATVDERTASGHKFGQRHHRAKFTNEEVDQILWLRDEGLTYSAIAAKWDDDKKIAVTTVRDICLGRIRSAHSDAQRTIKATGRLKAKSAQNGL
jgi:hypothetical protein